MPKRSDSPYPEIVYSEIDDVTTSERYSTVFLCSPVRKGLSYHLDAASSINPHIISAETAYSIFFLFYLVHFRDPVLVAPKDLSLSNLVVFPKPPFAGCAFDEENGNA